MTDTPILFRWAIAEDFEEVAAMIKQLYAADACTMGEIPDNHMASTFEAFLNDSKLLDIYVFELGGAIVGYATVTWFWSNEFGGKALVLDELFVKSGFRSTGIGKTFIAFMRDYYQDAAVFILEVAPSNEKARKLYEMLGFRDLKTRHMFLTK